MGLLTIDASVSVKFLVDEPGSHRARSFFPQLAGDDIRADHVLTAPTVMILETHHVLAKKIRRKLADPLMLSEAYPRLRLFVQFDAVGEDTMVEARRISLFGKARAAGAFPTYPGQHSAFNIFDCVYIAHAMSRGSTLVTADAELARIARDGFSVPVEFIDGASAT